MAAGLRQRQRQRQTHFGKPVVSLTPGSAERSTPSGQGSRVGLRLRFEVGLTPSRVGADSQQGGG